MSIINQKKFIVIDLYAGSYNIDNIGHELFNFVKNPIDGNYYGYCPPKDGIAIEKLGAKKNENYIDNVLVVYVSKKENSSNREIIAFCVNARVYKTGQSNEKLNRYFTDKDGQIKVSTYSVKSDNLFNLVNCYNKFEIKINDYSKMMFRKQRFYVGKYPNLEKNIIEYIENYIENKDLLDNDDIIEQEEIQNIESASSEEIQNAVNKPPSIINSSQGKSISKNSRISKAALKYSNYLCNINSDHKTFKTKHQVPYMEGHHLIPCTVNNSEYFYNKFGKNIDSLENIVCICPNCHREVHYGEWKTKSRKIKMLFKKQKDKLEKIGIFITENELLNLYKRK